MEIEVSKEYERGCGFRRPGLYLIGDGCFEPCERLPFPLTHCPVCGGGTKFSRGFGWITPQKLFREDIFPRCYLDRGGCADGSVLGTIRGHHHETCLMCRPPEGRHGLMWVGEKFYSPESFTVEAMARGISKRISGVPRGFELGKHVIYLAHKKAGERTGPSGPEKFQGVFMVFKPRRLDIVVDTTNPEELPARAKALKEKFGDVAHLVKVEPVFEQQPLNLQ